MLLLSIDKKLKTVYKNAYFKIKSNNIIKLIKNNEEGAIWCL
jgi:hypothetical protein